MANLLSVSSVLSTVFSILLALVILLIMISIHELGHYIAGKIFKFKINEFAIGMGPAIFKKKHKNSDEIFSIRLLPLGGYCAFEGEDEDSETEGAFNSKPAWQRIIVLVSGALMNLVLGVIVLTLSVGVYGQLSIKTYDIKPTQDAEYLGYTLQNDDIILEIDGNNIFMSTDIIDSLQGKSKGDVVEIKVQNGSQKLTRKVRLRNDASSKNLTDSFSAFTALGISTVEMVQGGELDGCYLLRVKDNDEYNNCSRIFYLTDLVTYAKTLEIGETLTFYYSESGSDRREKSIEISQDLSLLSDGEILNFIGVESTKTLLKYQTENVKFSFFETVERGLQYSVSVGGTIFKTLGQLLTGKLGVDAMGGTITTISMTAEAIKVGGFNYFLEMLGFIGINLAVFNLLPIPALDGSRVVFAVIEWIRKKPLNRKVEGIIHAVGLILLLGFSVFVDVLQLFR